jgi:hypothetical protein
VTGLVTINGKAAEGVYVQFHGVGPDRRLAPDGARTEADGKFSVAVHSTGEFVVTAFWPKVTVVDDEEIEGEDRLHGQYRTLSHAAAKVTIHDGPNDLPTINLTLR